MKNLLLAGAGLAYLILNPVPSNAGALSDELQFQNDILQDMQMDNDMREFNRQHHTETLRFCRRAYRKRSQFDDCMQALDN